MKTLQRISQIAKTAFLGAIVGATTFLPLSAESKSAEYARHGIPASQYQSVFNRVTASGYRLDWIDGFQVNGKVYYNAIFRPNNGSAWASFHGLTSSQYQSKFNLYTKSGFRPTQVESYRSGSGIRYAVIFRKQSGPAYYAYHGRTATQHQQILNQKTQAGYSPINISVVSVNGQRYYTGLYEKKNVGSFYAQSFLTPDQYQRYFDANYKRGRQLAYLNAYKHRGSTRFSAIWTSAGRGSFSARHGLTSGQYQQHWQSNTQNGRLTRVVTGYSHGTSSRYAALWR